VVAHEADRFVVLVTQEKLVARLGARAPIPVEVVPFAAPSVSRHLKALGGVPTLRLRADGSPYATDNNNYMIHTRFELLEAPTELEADILRIPGVVDTGMFLGMAQTVIVLERGNTRELHRP